MMTTNPDFYIVVANKERHYVSAKDRQSAVRKIQRRLLRKFGRYNITDVQIIARKKND